MSSPVVLQPAAIVPAPVSNIIAVAAVGSTVTPTPFLPLAPTATYFPTAYPTSMPLPDPPTPTPGVIPAQAKTWADYPGPTIWPDIAVPAPAGLLSQPLGQVNILLLGSDQRPDDGGFRTDTLLLLTLNPSAGTASLTSYPRDLYVYIPGWTVQRINMAHGFGGFPLTALTFEYNFGVRPDHYVLINLWSFEEVIDSLGGIDVSVAVSLTDHRDRYGNYSVPAGIVHMDGETALWYVRSRYTTSDFDRGRRQQEVIVAIFQKLLSMDALTRAPQIYEIYRQNVTTDMTFEQMAEFLPLAAQLSDLEGIQRYSIGPAQVVSWINYSGSQVLLPVQESVIEIMKKVLSSP